MNIKNVALMMALGAAFMEPGDLLRSTPTRQGKGRPGKKARRAKHKAIRQQKRKNRK